MTNSDRPQTGEARLRELLETFKARRDDYYDSAKCEMDDPEGGNAVAANQDTLVARAWQSAAYLLEAVLVRSAGSAQPPETPLDRYDAAHERFQRNEIRALKQTVAALVRQMTAAHLVPRVTGLDRAMDPPVVRMRVDPPTGDEILWASSSDEQAEGQR